MTAEPIEDFRYLLSPPDQPVSLTVTQFLVCCQAFGLQPARITMGSAVVVACKDRVVLLVGGLPVVVLSLDEWRDALVRLEPVPVRLSKE